MKALDVKYGDGKENADDYWKVAFEYNLDILALLDDEDVADKWETDIRAAQKDAKKGLNQMEDIEDFMEDMKYDDYDFSYEVIFCNVYDEDTKEFDKVMEKFRYVNTDMEDYVTEIAHISVLERAEWEYDGEDYTKVNTVDYTCYRIDGDWYVSVGWVGGSIEDEIEDAIGDIIGSIG